MAYRQKSLALIFYFIHQIHNPTKIWNTIQF